MKFSLVTVAKYNESNYSLYLKWKVCLLTLLKVKKFPFFGRRDLPSW